MAIGKLRGWSLAFGCALLGSCLGGGGAGDDGGSQAPGVCASITGGGSHVTKDISSGCFGCSITDEQAAADGDLTTFASVTAQTSFASQGASIRASAQLGVVFPAGQQVAVFFVSPASGGINPPDRSVTLTTYLSGTKQEDGGSYTTILQDSSHPYTFKGFIANKPFDAVEVMVSDTEAATGAWQLNEICSDATAPQ